MTTSTTADAAVFRELRRRFRDRVALDGMSARVPLGSITALLGRNGAGKTTAIRCLLGLLRPHGGSARLFESDGFPPPPAALARIGYVSERVSLDPRETLAEAADFASAFYERFDRGRFARLLDDLGLDPDRRLERLSAGERRKAALALRLACRPELLVLDEPAANLDPLVRREFLEVVLDAFRRDGTSVLLATHLLDDVERLADRVVFLERGRTRVEEELDVLKERVKTLRLLPRRGEPLPRLSLPGVLTERRAGDTLLVTVGDLHAPGVLERAREVGGEVDVLDLSLEEIFLAHARAWKEEP